MRLKVATAIACTHLVAACSPADDTNDDFVAEAPVWNVGSDPTLEIGEVDGASEYLMHQLVSSVGLPDDRIAALNAGSHELRIYDGSGHLIARTGREGSGPGEFRRPRRLYVAGDTLMVLDEGANRLSLHTLGGEFIGTRALSREPGRMQWDEWLHDRSWIDGPPFGQGRAAVIRGLAELPAPDSSEGYRYVRATSFGHLWVRQPAATDATSRAWHVHDLRGKLIGQAMLPAGFEIHDIGPDYLLGRATDSLGVEYLQRYEINTQDVEGRPAAVVPEFAVDGSVATDSAVAGVLRTALRMLTGSQEIYYSDPANDYHYADSHTKLPGFEPPDGVDVRIVTATNTGFKAIAMHRETGAMCGMAIGAMPPVGWMPGVAMCL